MATAWGRNPTAETSIIESIILAPYSRKEDFMGHPPVVSPASLRLARNEFRRDAESPMLHQVVSCAVAGVGDGPQMDVTPRCREFGNGQQFQILNMYRRVRQSRAEDRPGRIDGDAPHPVSGCRELDQIVNVRPDDPLLVLCRRLSPLGIVQQQPEC
jgi:hypothetical protein